MRKLLNTAYKAIRLQDLLLQLNNDCLTFFIYFLIYGYLERRQICYSKIFIHKPKKEVMISALKNRDTQKRFYFRQ